MSRLFKLFDTEKKRILLILSGIYLGAVILRVLLGLFTSANPFISPDENLYANLARSIHDNGVLSMRGQPLSFDNWLYSLLISPLYGLPESVNLFRAIQLFNAFIMNLAVFPAYFLAEKFTNSKKLSVAAAAVAILLPDMLMAYKIMSECLVYPLLLLTLCLMYKAFEDELPKPAVTVLTAFCAVLLYLSKAGMIAVGIVFALMLLLRTLKEKSIPRLIQTCVFLVSLYVFWVITRLIAVSVLKIDYSTVSLYETYKPTQFWDHLAKTLPGMLLYLFYTVIAFGVFPLLLPLSHLKLYTKPQIRFIILSALSVLCLGLGACYLFFASETVGNYFAGRIHIRYLFYFIPLFYMFSLAPVLKGAKANSKLLAAVAFITAMFVTVSFNSLLSNGTYCVDALQLSYIIFSDGVFKSRLFMQIIVMSFVLFMAYRLSRYGFGKKERITVVCFILTTVLLSNVTGSVMNRHNTEKELSADTLQMVQLSAGHTSAIVPTEYYHDNTLSVLDCSLRDTQYCISLADLCNSFGAYGSLKTVYPTKYWVENPINKIPVCDQYLFNKTIYSHAVLAKGVSAEVSDNGYFVRLTPSPDGRLFHSALTGVDATGKLLTEPSVWIFDQDLLSKETVKVYFQVYAAEPTTLVLYTQDESVSCSLNAGTQWVNGVFKTNGRQTLKVSVRCELAQTYIYTYQLE